MISADISHHYHHYSLFRCLTWTHFFATVNQQKAAFLSQSSRGRRRHHIWSHLLVCQTTFPSFLPSNWPSNGPFLLPPIAFTCSNLLLPSTFVSSLLFSLFFPSAFFPSHLTAVARLLLLPLAITAAVAPHCPLSLSLLCFAVFSGCRACCLQSADNNISVSPQTLNEVDVYAVRAYYIFPCSLFCRHLNSTSTAQRKRVKVFVLLCLPVNVVVPYRIKYIFYYYTASLQHILLLTTCKVDDTLFFCCDRIITFFFTLPKQLTSLTTFLLLVRRSIDITKPTCQSAKTHTKTHSTGWFAICNNNNCVCMYFSM